MAISTSNINKNSVYSSLQKSHLARSQNKGKPQGTFLLTGTKAVVAADYDVAGDKIELFEFPANTYLLGGSIIADKDFDTGGTAGTFDLVCVDDYGTAQTVTGATAQNMTAANQPSNEKVEILSDAAGDTTQKITIVGITTGTDTVVVEEMTLNGTTQVDSVKADWGVILAAWVSSGTLTAASTVTIREASGNATITTLTPAITTRGVFTPTDTAFGSRLVDLVAGGASSRQIGFKGTNAAGETIYDSQALNGTTKVTSNLAFATITQIYYGDIANATVVTVTPQEKLLVSAATVFNSADPTPLNYNGATTLTGEFATDVSDNMICLRVGTAPTTANTGTVTFTYKFLAFVGSPTTLA